MLLPKMKATVSLSVYRKKISIGLFTQFNRFTIMSSEIDLVRCLIHRAFRINSSYIIFHDKLEKIKFLLQETCTLNVLLIIKLKQFR